jgi:predicted Zn-dependent peptidase
MTVEEILAGIDAVTLDDTRALAAELLGGPLSLAVVGPYDDDQVFAA